MALHSPALIVGAISRFLSRPTQKKNLPGFVSFIGFDWFEILKRVGFCVILYVWILVAGVSRRVCVREEGGYFLHIFACYIDGLGSHGMLCRTAEWCKAIFHWPKTLWMWFSCFWEVFFFCVNSVPGRSCCFALSEINTMCAIFTAFHKFHRIHNDETFLCWLFILSCQLGCSKRLL